MKLKESMIAAIFALSTPSLVYAAADQGHGKVTFTGSIIDAPCSIAPESIDQTVDLGQISRVALAQTGTSIPRPFEIKLEQCDITTLKTVTTTFTGAASPDNSSLLAIAGTAKGAGVAISYDGQEIGLGEATSAQTLNNGSNTLHFAAYLKGTSETTSVVPGEFSAVADFTLAYQ